MHRHGHRCRAIGWADKSLDFERTNLAVEFGRAGMAVEPVESECTGMAIDVARTGMAVEFVEYERCQF